eukprot:1375804-Amorphochlora_amoeboformis.AAC.1
MRAMGHTSDNRTKKTSTEKETEIERERGREEDLAHGGLGFADALRQGCDEVHVSCESPGDSTISPR